jgi:hypothetical protein
MARGRKPRPKVEVDLDNDGKPDIEISVMDNEISTEIEEIQPKGDKIDALIADLYKNPETHRFIAPRLTGYKLAVGARTIAFKKSPTQKVGELITDDPWVIEQLLRHRACGNKYYPESPKLRNF